MILTTKLLYIQQTEKWAVASKRYEATADIIDFQPVKHPASCAGNLLIKRAIISRAITAAGGWSKRGWGTGTIIYPARPSAQATLPFAMIYRELTLANKS